MKQLFLFLISLSIFACAEGDITQNTLEEPSQAEETSSVYSETTYDVITEEDIIYAQGLSHESWNSEESEVIDLKLDVYKPDNTIANKPAIVHIHGGGFVGGDKQQDPIPYLGEYFASRGWVFFSVNYRLQNDYGTVPQEWVDAGNLMEESPDQFLAIYPAQRDCKAALRWVFANALDYQIDTNQVSVSGGSAGAVTAVNLGISAAADYTNELSITEDETLNSTNINQSYELQAIVDFWGSGVAVEAINQIYDTDRYHDQMPPLMIVHGTEDETVPYSSAIELKNIYVTQGVDYEFYPLEGSGHGPWGAYFYDLVLQELMFNFLLEQQGLNLAD